MSEHQILCGSCKGPAESVANPKADDKVTCPRCGREDRFDDVMRSVKQYVTDSAAKHLNSALADAVRGSNFIKVTKQYRPQSSHRWVTTDLGV